MTWAYFEPSDEAREFKQSRMKDDEDELLERLAEMTVELGSPLAAALRMFGDE